MFSLISGYDAADYTNVNQVSIKLKVMNMSLLSLQAKLTFGGFPLVNFPFSA